MATYHRIDRAKLTSEQRALWDQSEMSKPATPSGDQTIEQAYNLRDLSFRRECALEGVPIEDIESP